MHRFLRIPTRRRITNCVVAKLHRQNFCSFDIFAKLKDAPDAKDETKTNKRKPSDKVIRLVDEVMTLTLIEAADLCDLCQEKLAERMNGGQSIPGRTPFPHPANMFGGGGFMPQFSMGSGMQMPINTMPSTTLPTASQPTGEAASSETVEKKEAPKAEKSAFTILLKSYDMAKKVAVVKEIRSILQLGLKESKEFVEGAPKTIRKGVQKNEAEEIKKKLEACGAQVELQ